MQELKKYKSIIKKKKKHDKVVFLAKTKLNTIKVLISKALINLFTNHEEFVSVNNVVREYSEIKEKMQNPENSVEYSKKTVEMYCISCKKNTVYTNSSVRKSKQNRLMLLSN